jgi:enterobactin synthetase component D
MYPHGFQPSRSPGTTTMLKDHESRVVGVHDLRKALSVPATVGLFAGMTEELGDPGMSLPPSIKRSSKKRQREFAAGRYCASRALQSAGHELDVDLSIGVDRLPNWPSGWIGSISHCTTVTIAIACQTSLHSGLGVDVEEWMDTQVAESIQFEIALPGEIALFPSLSSHQALTLLFSAKEALYKALFPLARQFFDFKAVRAINVTESTLTLRLGINLGERWSYGSDFVMTYALFPHHVFTMLCL